MSAIHQMWRGNVRWNENLLLMGTSLPRCTLPSPSKLSPFHFSLFPHTPRSVVFKAIVYECALNTERKFWSVCEIFIAYKIWVCLLVCDLKGYKKRITFVERVIYAKYNYCTVLY